MNTRACESPLPSNKNTTFSHGENMDLPPEKHFNSQRPFPHLVSEIVIGTDSTLMESCILDILSSFLLRIAHSVKQVEGITRSATPEEITKEDKPRKGRAGRCNFLRTTKNRWRNSVFTEIAEILVDLGLTSDIAEAYMVIVPAFATRCLLPSQVSPHE
jgi:hypothetical protein